MKKEKIIDKVTNYESLGDEQVPALKVNDYKRYLLKTKSAAKKDIEPTEYIRKIRIK